MLHHLRDQARLLGVGRLILAATLWFNVAQGTLTAGQALEFGGLLALATALNFGPSFAVSTAVIIDVAVCLTRIWLTPAHTDTWFALLLPVFEGALAAGAVGGIVVAVIVSLLLVPLSFAHDSLPHPGLYVVSVFARLGSLGGIMGWLISQMRRAREQVQHLALHDSLTGLRNSRALYADLTRRCQQASAERPLSVLFFDANHMKQINDGYGHHTGDEYLATLANELQSTLGPDYALYRYAGDEFVALADTDQDGGQHRMTLALTHLAAVPFQDITLSASGGLAVWQADRRTPEALLSGADSAMYEAKRRHKSARRREVPPA